MTQKEIKERIKEIDRILDSDIPDEEFDKLESEARTLTWELGIIERMECLRNVKELFNLNDWEKNFLTSFEIGTQVISLRQLDVFKKMNHNKSFSCNGKRYDFSLHFSGKGALLSVTKI